MEHRQLNFAQVALQLVHDVLPGAHDGRRRVIEHQPATALVQKGVVVRAIEAHHAAQLIGVPPWGDAQIHLDQIHLLQRQPYRHHFPPELHLRYSLVCRVDALQAGNSLQCAMVGQVVGLDIAFHHIPYGHVDETLV